MEKMEEREKEELLEKEGKTLKYPETRDMNDEMEGGRERGKFGK